METEIITETEKTSKNVFANRNFRLVFFGALVSELGSALYSFAVSFYILEVSNNNAFLQGMYLALCGLMLLLFTPVGGVLGDRFNKAGIMFICDYIKGGLILLATVAMTVFDAPSAQIVVLFGVGAVGNAVSGVFSPAAGAIFPHIIDESRLQQANSYFTIKSSLLGIFGVVLAGILYSTVPVILLFLLVGICFVISGVSEMFIRYTEAKREEHLTLKLALSDMAEGVRYVREKKAILVFMLSILFINFFFSPVTANFLPFFIKTDIAGAPSYMFDGFLKPEMWSSVISVIFGISSLVSAAVLSAKEQDEKCGRKVSGLLIIIAVVTVMLLAGYYILVDRGVSLNAFIITFCVGSLFIGYLIPAINIPVGTMFMRVVDRDKLSKVGSITNVLSQGLVPISTALAGVVLQNLGSTALLLGCAVGFTATALFMLFNKDVKTL
ncbi:MAG: MFS transporter [Lachnospiraceae bacterium]|nr:MFS transporter [Lachnospiraceae bacterium]